MVANYHLTARDIMQTEIATVLGDLSITEAADLMRFAGTRSLLVVPRNTAEAYGIVCYSDIVYQVLAECVDPRQMTVDEVSTTPAIAVRPNDTIQEISVLFRKHQIGHAPVIDADEGLVGMVSMTDLVTEVITEPK
ncbi:MAG: CBS domain-containing protein [Chloroflexi bacterium]|nr:CBS domain-containing protein [Chloroflexota bacterium]